MGRDLDRYVWVLFLFVFVVGLAGASASPKRAVQSPQTAADLQWVMGWIKDMEVVVRHDGGLKPSHTYRNFSATQSRMEGHLIIIEGKVSEAPLSEEATFTITLHAAPPHDVWDRTDAELYEDYRDKEDEH